MPSTPMLVLYDALLNNRYILTGLSVVFYWILLSYYRGETRKLRHVPSVGLTLPLFSLIDALRFMANPRPFVDEGVSRWPKNMFKVPELSRWVVVMADPVLIEDVRKAPESILTDCENLNELIQAKYTLGVNISENPYHVPIIRAQLTRALPRLVPEVHDEIVAAFGDVMPASDDWQAVLALATAMKIVCRASHRIFVGYPLCRDPDFINLNVQFTSDVVSTASILRLMPGFAKPLVNSLISNLPKRIRHALKYLRPVIQARREALGGKDKDDREAPDLLTWLMMEANEEQLSDWNLTTRLLTIISAAIHTSSMTFTQALYYLAAAPECLLPLRMEIEEVVAREGWSKNALDQMHKVDSFIKESQRLHPLDDLTMRRALVKDHTFSDGTTLPRGTRISVPAQHRHLSEESYEDPLVFDPFRFSRLKEQDTTTAKKLDMISTSLDWLAFGHGRHACPGRFFAASEIKLMFAHIAITYDVKLETEGVRPPDVLIMSSHLPNPKTKLLFRKRRA